MQRVEKYEAVLAKLKAEEKQFKQKLAQILLLRLATFGLVLLGIYFLWAIHYGWSIAVGLLGIVVFLRLVKVQSGVKLLLEINREKQGLNNAEILAQSGNYSAFSGGDYHKKIDHAYAYDLDVFGENSFYQSLNRTATYAGDKLLGSMINGESEYTESLPERHDIVQEMSQKFDLRQMFYVYGKMYGSDKNEISQLNSWHKNFKPYVSLSMFWKAYKYVMPILAFTALVLNIIGLISTLHFILFILVPLGFTGMKVKDTNKTHFSSSKQYDILKKAGKLLELVEKEKFSSESLSNKKTQLTNDGWKSSDIENLGKIMASFDNRLNPVMVMVLNIFFAWDFHCTHQLEKWMDNYGKNFSQLYHQLAWWDAQVSLSTYHYNHPNFIFPTESNTVLKAEQVGHPFLPDNVCVKNDFELNGEGEFVIITGANMAGKSTFLRTVGLSLVMAKMGLPVYAKSYTFKPLDIYTSMRTTDSLQENESYFYTELKRLKALTTRLESGQSLFVILDEILKGTNSKDKAEGSKRFVKKLLNFPVVGIIATHDLSLTSLGEEEDKVKNLCFEVEFGKDDLIFDYTLKPGVCKNMNATWLLEKMELV